MDRELQGDNLDIVVGIDDIEDLVGIPGVEDIPDKDDYHKVAYHEVDMVLVVVDSPDDLDILVDDSQGVVGGTPEVLHGVVSLVYLVVKLVHLAPLVIAALKRTSEALVELEEMIELAVAEGLVL